MLRFTACFNTKQLNYRFNQPGPVEQIHNMFYILEALMFLSLRTYGALSQLQFCYPYNLVSDATAWGR